MRLREICDQVENLMLQRQDAVTGLLPASTAVTSHGDYTDAWVRDNVYSILCVWGCGLALRRHCRGDARAYLFEQSVVKTMRGLLTAMMRQAHKVERFKHTLHPHDALHAKYGSRTGDPVVADDGWGHLQLDATSVFLLMLAQMTASGLRIVFTRDEVDFVQGLVHYIALAHRTPDYGIWERGDKTNTGDPEINASSVGMAKAALEALRGFDLFGAEGGPESVLHVSADDIARMRNLLEATLPRESRSKEVDAALLSVIGYPAYAVEDADLVERTLDEIVTKLQGRYGCKRFLRDGHQTVLEDPGRLHYESGELARFEGIESEWPLFFTYLMLDGLVRGREQQAQNYAGRLAGLCVERDGLRLLPELYYVPHAAVEAEKARPGSQKRLPNDNVPLYWAQSLYWLATLLDEGWLHPSDIDPLARRERIGHRRECLVQVVLVAASREVQATLSAAGVPAQTAAEIAPVSVRHADDLTRALARVGRNAKLGLSGRPRRGVGTLVTCQVFTLGGETVVFLPQFMAPQDFYLSLDNRLLVERCKAEFRHVRRHWDQPGQPVFTLRITPAMLAGEGADELLGFLRELCAGNCEGLPVRVRPLSMLLASAGRKDLGSLSFERPALGIEAVRPEAADYDEAATHPLDVGTMQRLGERADDELLATLAASRNLHERVAVLETLVRRHGLEHPLPAGGTLHGALAHAYALAAEARHWGLLRRCAGLLDRHDPKFEDAVANIVGHRKQLALGRAFSAESVVASPLPNHELMAKLRQLGGDDPAGRMLLQEIVLFLAMLLKADPEPFRHTLTLRAWQLLLLIVGQHAWEARVSQAEAYQQVQALSPSKLMARLQAVVNAPDDSVGHLARLESLRREDATGTLATPGAGGYAAAEAVPGDGVEAAAEVDWLARRQRSGVLTRLPPSFYEQVWEVLAHCGGLVIGERLDIARRLDSASLRADMTAAETNFALTIERLLGDIHSPEYRQLCIEALLTLAEICAANPELHVTDAIVLDVLIGHAVRLAWIGSDAQRAVRYDAERTRAWEAFYASPPEAVRTAFIAAFAHLLGATPLPPTAEPATAATASAPA